MTEHGLAPVQSSERINEIDIVRRGDLNYTGYILRSDFLEQFMV